MYYDWNIQAPFVVYTHSYIIIVKKIESKTSDILLKIFTMKSNLMTFNICIK